MDEKVESLGRYCQCAGVSEREQKMQRMSSWWSAAAVRLRGDANFAVNGSGQARRDRGT